MGPLATVGHDKLLILLTRVAPSTGTTQSPNFQVSGRGSVKLGRKKRVAESTTKDFNRCNKKGGRRPSKIGS